MKNVRTLTITALLTAFAIIIPLYFGFLKVVLVPSFTATIASHVPMFLAMLLGPGAAVAVGIGSTLGFFMTTPLVIAARASMHIIVGLAGAILVKRGISFPKVVALTAPIHGLLEALVIFPVIGVAAATVQSPVVGIGTVIHHCVDGAIAFALIKALSRTGKSIFEENRRVA
jgi:niacin transporter